MTEGVINFTNLLERVINFLPAMISAVVIFILTLIAAGLIQRWVRRLLVKRNLLAPISHLLSKVAYWSVIIFGLITSLQQVGFNLTAFLTGVGIVGFTIGFALQDVSKNFISGILLLIQEPFEIGDAIEVAGFSGTVLMIDLRATEIKTLDGRIVLIPNTDVFTSPIINFTKAASRRIEIQIGVAYNSSLPLVREKIMEAIEQVPGKLSDPAPQVYLQNFAASTLDVNAYFWIDTQLTNLFAAKDEVLEAINRIFATAGIDMPYPTQLIMVQQPTA